MKSIKAINQIWIIKKKPEQIKGAVPRDLGQTGAAWGENRGSATIETAMLMPFVLLAVLLLVGFLIWIYNRNIMQVAACQSAMQLYYEQGNSNQAIKEKCMAKAAEVLADHSAGMKNSKVEVVVDRFRVRLSVQGDSWLDGQRFMDQSFHELLPKARGEWEISRFSQTELIRNIRKAKVVYEFGKGFVDSGEGE